jgi:2-dehydro-3-deoxyphosphogluconate aldolase/(4S)-4-hydroxy-2-oxoglutarate aldolase
MTPSDVELCVNHGFHVLKLFPAGDLPTGYIKSLKGPFDNTDYVAVGGVKADNIVNFLNSGFIGVGIGSNLVPKEIIDRKDWAAATAYITELIRSIPTLS